MLNKEICKLCYSKRNRNNIDASWENKTVVCEMSHETTEGQSNFFYFTKIDTKIPHCDYALEHIISDSKEK